MANAIYNKLKKFFNVIPTTNTSGAKGLMPAKYDDIIKDFKQIPIPNEYKRMWDWYINQVNQEYASYADRQKRYADLSFMVINDPYLSMAADLYADETVQMDSTTDTLLKIESTNKAFEEWANNFLENIGVKQTVLRETAWDLALYGDHFWLLSITAKEGIKKIIPVDVNDIQNRIEFSLNKVIKDFSEKGYYSSVSKSETFKQLYKLYTEKVSEDISLMFEPYLFGYQIADSFLAPWNVVHFRRFSTKSEFFPYGKSLFIYAIAPYRQLSAGMNLQSMARMANFPLKIMSVKIPEGTDYEETWDLTNETRQNYYNQTVNPTKKDSFSLESEVWVPENLVEMKIENPSLNIDEIADLEFLENRMIATLRIPKGYLIAGDRGGAWGNSGTALLHQHKPFGRAVFSNQTPIIEQIINIIDMQRALTGKFPDVEYEVSMYFPAVEEASDILRNKSDSLTLANSIIASLKDALTLDQNEALPVEVVKDILQSYSFLNGDDLSKWIEDYQKSLKDINNVEEAIIKGKQKFEKFYSHSLMKTLKEDYLKKIQNNKKEGLKEKRHFIKNTTDTNLYREYANIIKSSKTNKLVEQMQSKGLKFK